MGDLQISQIIPPGPVVTIGPMGDPAKPTLTGGWNVIARPRRKGATEWGGFDPASIAVPVMADGFIDDSPVEALVATIEGMMRSTPDGQPPVLSLAGPVPFTNLQWVLNGIDYGDAIRRPVDNARVRQAMTLTFLEYVPIEIVTATRVTPAVAAADRATTAAGGSGSGGAAAGGGGTYTVKSGDTLSGIAARVLGSSGRWTEIADMNGIRDPRTLRVGQVLRMPGGSTPAPTNTRVATSTKASSTKTTITAPQVLPNAGRKIPF